MGDELKPCPFCAVEVSEYPNDERHARLIVHPVGNGHCPCAGKVFVRSAWNTRTETQSQATIDELVGALKACRDRFRRCIIHNGTDPEYADAAVAEYDTLIAKAGGQS